MMAFGAWRLFQKKKNAGGGLIGGSALRGRPEKMAPSWHVWQRAAGGRAKTRKKMRGR